MQSTVVELSRYSASDKSTNSEWTNTLAKQIKIEDGDFVMVKQAFIDTRLVDSNSILIEQDVEWTLQFMFWVQGHGISQYITDGTNNPTHIGRMIPDGLPYYLVDARTQPAPDAGFVSGTPVVDSFTIKIPKGIYERGYLADFISRQLQGIGQPPNTSYANTKFTNGFSAPKYDSCGNFLYFKEPAGNDQPQNVVTSFQKPLLLGYCNDPDSPSHMLYRDTYGNWIPCYYAPMTDAEGYSQTQPSKLVTRALSSGGLGPWSINNFTNALYDGTTIGASQVSFVYNDNNGDGKFSFQYMHTPLENNGNESVAIYINQGGTDITAVNIAYLNAYSGIMFVGMFTNFSPPGSNMNEDPFLKLLGVSYNDFVPPQIIPFMNQMNRPFYQDFQALSYYDTFLPYTTRNFMSLGTQTKGTFENVKVSNTVNIDNSGNPTAVTYKITDNASVYAQIFRFDPSGLPCYNFSQSTTSVNVYAKSSPISSNINAGHYLVELQCSYENEYISQDKSYQVKAMVGSFYLSPDSFTMSMAPDSYIYQHKGEPVSLASVKVRILNPVTKLPEQNMGENSTVYLQVTKENAPQETHKKE
jgi:hypothetical protein